MAADVKTVTFILVGPADSADQVCIGLERDAWVAVLGQLIRGGQPGRARAGDDGGIRGDDGDSIRVVDASPTVRQQRGTQSVGSGRVVPHPVPPSLAERLRVVASCRG